MPIPSQPSLEPLSPSIEPEIVALQHFEHDGVDWWNLQARVEDAFFVGTASFWPTNQDVHIVGFPEMLRPAITTWIREITRKQSGFRASWEQTAMEIASVMSQRSTCPRLKAGAVVCSPDNQVLTTGYNGAPRGQAHCFDLGCDMDGDHCVRALHAEHNAVLQAARHGISLRGTTLYATHRPCIRCALTIMQVGISAVVYRADYDSDHRKENVMSLFSSAGIVLREIEVASA